MRLSHSGWLKSVVLATSVATVSLTNRASAVSVAWDGGGGAAPNSQFNVADNWSDDTGPTSGNDYAISGAFANIPQTIDASTSTFAGGSLALDSGATLQFYRTNSGSGVTINHTIPGFTVSDSTLLISSSLGSVTHVLNSPVTFSGTNSINLIGGSYTNQLRFNSTVSGSGTLNLIRPNSGSVRIVTLLSDSDASSFSGNWDLTGQNSTRRIEFNVNSANGWGSGNVTLNKYADMKIDASLAISAAGSTVNVNADTATFTLSNNTTTIATLNGVVGSTVTAAGASSALNVGSGDFIGDVKGTTSIAKRTTGTLTLAGTNDYSGTTTIAGGTLLMNGTHTGGDAYTIASGATLGGVGSTASAVTVTGTIAPGTSIGTLAVGNTTIDGNYLLEADTSGAADLLNVTGLLTLNGGSSVLDLDVSSALNPTLIYTIANYTSLNGSFNTVDSTILATHTVDYFTGNQIRLVPVPEPASFALLLCGGLAMWLFRKR